MIKTTRILIAAAVAGITFGVTVPALGATTPDDCALTASTDRTLCHRVQLQHPYGAYLSVANNDPNPGWTSPNGKTLVHEITHSGLTRAQMHDSLTSEATSYRLWVTAVPADMDAIVSKCGDHNGQWVTSFVKSGGVYMTRKRVVCL